MSNNIQPPGTGRGTVLNPAGQPSFSQFAANPANLAPGLFGPTPPGFGNRQGFAPPVSPFTSTSGLGGNPGMVGGIGGANTPELQNLRTVMRTITTELQGLARVIQQVNRGAGVAGGAGGGVAGGTGGLPGGVPGAVASSVRFRDAATGRFVAGGGGADVVRTLGAGSMGGGVAGGGMANNNMIPAPVAPIGVAPNQRAGYVTRPAGFYTRNMPLNTQDKTYGYQMPPHIREAMGISPEQYVQPQGEIFLSNNPTQRQREAFQGATTNFERLVSGRQAYVEGNIPGGPQESDLPGRRPFFSGRAGAARYRSNAARLRNMAQNIEPIDVDNLALEYAGGRPELVTPEIRSRAARTAGAAAAARRSTEAVAAQNEAAAVSATRGSNTAAVAKFVGKATLGISGASASQIASSIPFVGGLVSAPFQVAEGLAGQFGNEYAAAVARGSQGLGVGSGRQNIEALYGLRRFGITADQAAAFGTEYGSITGREFGATQVGLMARGLSAGQVGQAEMMGVMGVGFNARTTGGGSFGLRAMGAAQGMGIQGVQSQLGFAQALASAGQGLLGQGAIVDVNRFMGGVRGIAAGGRVTGTDAITLQASGQSAIQTGTRGFLSSMFGDLDQSLTFSRLLSQNGGDIAAAARAAEQETPQQRIAANIQRFGKAGELGAITTFGANATTEFRRGARRGGLGKAIEGIDISGGTQASAQVLGTQMRQVGTAYDNQDKIIAVLEANNRLQEELMKAVTPEFIEGVSTSLTTIASATTSILNFVVSKIMQYTGATAQPLAPMKAGSLK